MAVDSKDLNLAFTFDHNFVTPFYVLITSIFKNNKSNRITLHVIATGIDSHEKNAIQSFVKENNAEINFYTIGDNFDSNKFPISSTSHLTIATYYRLFLTDLIPNNVEKLLYIDIDVIVKGDLSEINAIDLSSVPAAACIDAMMGRRPELGINEENNYFNAGVILINVPKWKEQKVIEKALDYLISNSEIIQFADQDALNAILKGNWLKLPNRFNLQTPSVPNLPHEQYKNYLKDKIIIHYVSDNKPWKKFCTHRLKFLYDHYLLQSPKSPLRHQKGFALFREKAKRYISNQIVHIYLNYPLIYKIWQKARNI